MIRCSWCEKEIRGNAAFETYDEAKQTMHYRCIVCEAILAQASVLAAKAIDAAEAAEERRTGWGVQ